ncbi:lysophospholipid acyltransferase family protein [Streptacidiphilus carbonis]|jgi:1-acyl-sn-glycerol-3-phosphate acyltransferase|uniref:lysophospholipid acyltransferase family protein n=1 Tax=Streptacidiphilus carbonis TaxID=105422 RepID=UPI0005A741AA|nr:lysophospholipid acyltransferase family protein [Streptacidiphilus carbonis]
MLSDFARRVLPLLGHLQVTGDVPDGPGPGSIVAANHSSLIDPGVVLAALARRGVHDPVVLAAAGLWRIPLLGGRLRAEGHIPVHRGDRRASDALDLAAEALAEGRVVVVYPEGRLPRRLDSGDRDPEPFRTGLARLALATGAPVVPLGQTGARRITSGSRAKQLAGLATSPLRRPDLHVHLGAPIHLTGTPAEATAQAHAAVARARSTAAGAAEPTVSEDAVELPERAPAPR